MAIRVFSPDDNNDDANGHYYDDYDYYKDEYNDSYNGDDYDGDEE